MKSSQKLIAAFILVLFMAGLVNGPALAAELEPELELSAKAAVLIEAETGKIIYAHNADEPLPPASLTKIMTLLVAMEEKDRGVVDWDTMITASQRAWAVSEAGATSTMFLNIGQQASFKDMIKGIAIISANDACVAVAEHLYGSEDAFVQQMNQRAEELGLENSNFMNTHGLQHPDQYMSALDVARLAAFLIKTQPEAAAFQGEREFTFNEIWQQNRNPLLGAYSGADGVKTGFTGQAGWCLAASAKQNGMRLVSVVLNASSERQRGIDSEVLLNYGFRQYELRALYDDGETVAFTPITRGQKTELALVANGPVGAPVPRGDNDYVLEERLVLSGSLEAPVEAGQPVGSLQLVEPTGEVLREIPLFAGESMERIGFFSSVFRSIGKFFGGLWERGRNA